MGFLPCVKSYDENVDNSKQIDREIKHWIKSYNEAIKLLLLGTGESGKTTIIKQMKILHVQGFSASDKIEKVKHIRHNVHESIYDIVRNMKTLSIALQTIKNVQSQQFILKLGPEGPEEYSEEYFDHVRALWRDGGVKECFRRSNEYQLIDSAEYFLDRIDLLVKPDYSPSDADILRCRQKTTGIQKIEFKVKVPKSMHGGTQEFWMFDVGGQRGERKKWIQVFEGIHAIWFLVACSDFDQTLREDTDQNRLKEALVLFEDVWQSRFLLEAGLIVFLNKQDILERKVSAGRSVAPYFPEYNQFKEDPDEYTNTRLFIRKMFADITKKKRDGKKQTASAERFVLTEGSRPRECYFHFTTATDTDNVRTVFRDVHQMILTHMLTNIGDITKKKQTASAERFVLTEGSRPRECYFHFTTATDTDNVRTVFRDVHQMILTHMLTNIGDITKKKRDGKKQTASAERFVLTEGSRPRECYFHFTTATDTDNVRTVFRDVHQMILTHMLTNIGVY